MIKYLFIAAFSALSVVVTSHANAAALPPELGYMLDGGAFDGLADFVRTTNNGTGTLQAGQTLTAGDTLQAVLAFSTQGSDIAGSTDPLLGPGFGAIVFSGEVVSSGTGLEIAAAGNLASTLSGVSDVGNGFAVLLTSPTVDFTTGLPAINAAGSDVDALATFDLSGPTSITSSYSAIVGELNVFFGATLNAQPGTIVDGLSFIDVPDASPLFDLISSNDSLVGNIAFANAATSGTKSIQGAQLVLLNPVPEPGSLFAIAGLFAGFGAVSCRRRRNTARKAVIS